MADTNILKNYLDKAGVKDIFEIILEHHYTIEEVDALLQAIKTELAGKADTTEIPNLEGYATQEWVEEQDYLTEHQSLEEYAKKSDLPTDYLTEEDLEDYVKEEDLPEVPDVTKYPDGASYDSESKKIKFTHDGTELEGMEINAAEFVKDGMVTGVEITDGSGDNDGKKVLLITFNTDAGAEDIEIPIEDIFNASNYYTKDEVDGMLEKIGSIAKEDILAAYTEAKAAKN